MGKDYNQIKSTVLPEGVRRLTKIIGVVAALIIFIILSASIRDGWFTGLLLGVGVYYLIPLIAKALFWIKNGF